MHMYYPYMKYGKCTEKVEKSVMWTLHQVTSFDDITI